MVLNVQRMQHHGFLLGSLQPTECRCPIMDHYSSDVSLLHAFPSATCQLYSADATQNSSRHGQLDQ
jgi:hypothetical protein